jgi:ketosteroid isomerase-like protein
LCKRAADPEHYDPGMMTETTTDDATLTQLNQQYVNAFLNSNVDWYDTHLTDDFVCIESDGTMLDKRSFLLDTAKGPGAVASYRLLTVRVRILGDTAFIHAQGQATRTDGGQINSRYTDVWVRQRGEWKAASAQITRIAS